MDISSSLGFLGLSIADALTFNSKSLYGKKLKLKTSICKLFKDYQSSMDGLPGPFFVLSSAHADAEGQSKSVIF